MASDAFSDGRWTAHNAELCVPGNSASPAQNQNFFAELTNSLVELWRANIAKFTSLSQIDEFKSKTLYARLWRESGGPLDAKQVEELQAAAELRSAQLAAVRYKRGPSKQFTQPFLLGFLATPKQPATVPVRRQSWRKGRCELGFWRNLSKEDGRLIIKAAQRYEEHSRNSGERIGALGPIGLEILKLFVNLAIAGSGRLEPQLTWIMLKVQRSKCAVVAALARLRDHGFIEWRRRYIPTGSEGAGPQVKQTSNAYRIIIETAKRIASGFERPSFLADDLGQARNEYDSLSWSAAVHQPDERESAERTGTSPILYSKGTNKNGRPYNRAEGRPTGRVRRFARRKPLSG